MSRKAASKKFAEQPRAFWQAEFLCSSILPATVRRDEFDHKSADWVPATHVWWQTTGFKPEPDKMQAHSERVREVFSRPTPRVDAIVAEVEKARVRVGPQDPDLGEARGPRTGKRDGATRTRHGGGHGPQIISRCTRGRAGANAGAVARDRSRGSTLASSS